MNIRQKLSFNLGLNWGFLNFGVAYEREWFSTTQGNLQQANDYWQNWYYQSVNQNFQYLDQISQLRHETRTLKSQISVLESSRSNLLALQRRDRQKLTRLLHIADELAIDSGYEEGILSLPKFIDDLLLDDPILSYFSIPICSQPFAAPDRLYLRHIPWEGDVRIQNDYINAPRYPNMSIVEEDPLVRFLNSKYSGQPLSVFK